MTLKIKSRSPKSKQIITPSQHCIYASLVKICPLVQKIIPGNEISYITKGRCDLENEVKVTKIYSTLHTLPTLYLCKFGLNLSTGTETKFHILKKVAVTLKIGSRSPKSNQLVPPSQQCICASLVKICPSVQKITHGNEATRTPTGSAPKTICPHPPSVEGP